VIHVDIWNKPIQYCKAIILQLIFLNRPNFIGFLQELIFKTWVIWTHGFGGGIVRNNRILVGQLEGIKY